MRFVLLMLCIAASQAQAAELYRWVDADGKVHYTDQPPPASAKNVEEKKLSGNTIDTSQLPYAMQQAVKKSPVTLYANECGEPCTQAREHLGRRGIPYTGKNPETTPADAEALKKLAGSTFVPTLVVGGSVSKGYEKAAWDAALDAAGYPKSALPKSMMPKPKAAGGAAPEQPVVPPPSHPWAGGR